MIVLTLSGDAATLERALVGADRRADLVELRLERASRSALARLADAARAARRRWIATCRPRGEGGAFEGTEADRVALLRAAAAAGAARIDLEAGTDAEALLGELPPERVILSRHDRGAFAAEAPARLAALRSAAPRPAWVKYVPGAGRARDLLAVRRLLLGAGGDAAVFAAGSAGRASRALARAWGSVATYAVADGERPAAPGQPTIGELLDEWDERALSSTTPLTGVGGRPLGHSLSPAMHNAVLGALGRPERLLPFEAEDVDDLLAAAEGLGLRGLAVTTPFKEPAAARCDRLGDAARATGSVNTLVRDRHGWLGESTDGEGFVASLRGMRVPQTAAVAVLGAGGAAAAVAFALRRSGRRVTLHARREDRARALAARVGAVAGAWEAAPAAGTHLLVNATPVGQDDPDAIPIAPERLEGLRAVVDLVYGPRPTRLVREARRRGIAAADGLPMLVEQARRQMRLLYGVDPPPARLRAACKSALARRAGPGGGDGGDGL